MFFNNKTQLWKNGLLLIKIIFSKLSKTKFLIKIKLNSKHIISFRKEILKVKNKNLKVENIFL